MALLQPRDIFRVLAAHGVRYVVIGNLGGTLHGSPLVTNDIDLCPSRDDANLAYAATQADAAYRAAQFAAYQARNQAASANAKACTAP